MKAVVLSIDAAIERVALGIKQLTGDPLAGVASAHKKGEVVKVTVADVSADGLTVTLDGVEAFIKTRDLGLDKAAQDPFAYTEGQVVDAKITALSGKDRKLGLSIRALVQDEERDNVATYANQADSGDSVMASALKAAGVKGKKKAEADTAAEADAKPAAKKAAKQADADEAAEAKPAKKAAKAKADA